MLSPVCVRADAAVQAGLRVPSIRVNDLVHALTRATTDRIMREKAVIVGQRIRAVRRPSPSLPPVLICADERGVFCRRTALVSRCTRSTRISLALRARVSRRTERNED